MSREFFNVCLLPQKKYYSGRRINWLRDKAPAWNCSRASSAKYPPVDSEYDEEFGDVM